MTYSPKAVSSCVDNETVTVLAKIAPNMVMHTETDLSASLVMKEGAENPTLTPTTGHIRQNNHGYRLVHQNVYSTVLLLATAQASECLPMILMIEQTDYLYTYLLNQ